MKQVTREEFYRIIYEKKLDVHPCSDRGALHITHWQFHNQFGRPLFGISKARLNSHGGHIYEPSQGDGIVRVETDYFVEEKYL